MRGKSAVHALPLAAEGLRMTCEVELRSDAIHVRGEMNIYEAPSVASQLFELLQAPTPAQAVDLSAVSEFDMTGLQVLLVALRECAAREVRLALRAPSPSVREALLLVGMSDRIEAPARGASA
jgi:anti-anti-sigma factor